MVKTIVATTTMATMAGVFSGDFAFFSKEELEEDDELEEGKGEYHCCDYYPDNNGSRFLSRESAFFSKDNLEEEDELEEDKDEFEYHCCDYYPGNNGWSFFFLERQGGQS